MCMYVHILLPFQCAYPQKAQGGPASPFSVGEVGVQGDAAWPSLQGDAAWPSPLVPSSPHVSVSVQV